MGEDIVINLMVPQGTGAIIAISSLIAIIRVVKWLIDIFL